MIPETNELMLMGA